MINPSKYIIALTLFLVACSSTAPNDKANLIQLESPLPGEEISFPLTITGRARGYWFFEANFPVALEDADGNLLYETYAQAQDEWMTEEFVEFTAILSPDFAIEGPGRIVLKHSNASGLPERDDQLVVPVQFAQ